MGTSKLIPWQYATGIATIDHDESSGNSGDLRHDELFQRFSNRAQYITTIRVLL